MFGYKSIFFVPLHVYESIMLSFTYVSVDSLVPSSLTSPTMLPKSSIKPCSFNSALVCISAAGSSKFSGAEPISLNLALNIFLSSATSIPLELLSQFSSSLLALYFVGS